MYNYSDVKYSFNCHTASVELNVRENEDLIDLLENKEIFKRLEVVAKRYEILRKEEERVATKMQEN